MKDRRKLIAVVCGSIILLGLFVTAGQRLLGLRLFGGTSGLVNLPAPPMITGEIEVGAEPEVETGITQSEARQMSGDCEADGMSVFSPLTPTANGKVVDVTKTDEGDKQLEPFQSLDVQVSDAEIKLIPSEGFRLKYCYYTDLREFHYTISNGTLKIWDEINEKYKNPIGTGFSMSGSWNIPDSYVELYYPKGTVFNAVTIEDFYGDTVLGAMDAESLIVNLHSGDGQFDDVRAKKFSLVADYGDISILNSSPFTADEVGLELHSGDLHLKGLSSAGAMKIIANYGDVTLQGLKAKTLDVEAHSGDVKWTDVDGGNACIFDGYGDVVLKDIVTANLKVKGSSGDVILSGLLSGLTEVMAYYGDVGISTSAPAKDYNYTLSVNYGSIYVNGEAALNSDGDYAQKVQVGSFAPNTILVESSSGDVDLKFQG